MIFAFGPNPNSYYIGHGRHCRAKGLPLSLLNELQGRLKAITLQWLSIANDGRSWAAGEVLEGKIIYDLCLPEQIKAAFNGTGRAVCNYVSFGERPAAQSHFLKASQGGWVAEIPDPRILGTVQRTRATVPNFDTRIQRILFGKGGTTIFVSEGSIWHAEFSPEANFPGHPLFQAFQKHSNDD